VGPPKMPIGLYNNGWHICYVAMYSEHYTMCHNKCVAQIKMVNVEAKPLYWHAVTHNYKVLCFPKWVKW
jgi:hypothetical protein